MCSTSCQVVFLVQKMRQEKPNLENRFGILTTNPESETHWLYKHFYLDDNPDLVHFDTTTYDNVMLPDYEKLYQETGT